MVSPGSGTAAWGYDAVTKRPGVYAGKGYITMASSRNSKILFLPGGSPWWWAYLLLLVGTWSLVVLSFFVPAIDQVISSIVFIALGLAVGLLVSDRRKHGSGKS